MSCCNGPGSRKPSGTTGVVTELGVVIAAHTGGALPEGFIAEFATALGKHRVWARDASAVPA
ncbi:hypothetical protein [Saccharopolyspora spinosa]|uniref:hypothetical protein n=1 Tax=Saccharopolyspora spinosa TaxID=60894 RepID=UPI000237A3E0|nr:hypothetical protein [Saccharopolyspora spinosa]